jgi:hypothetical protein
MRTNELTHPVIGNGFFALMAKALTPSTQRRESLPLPATAGVVAAEDEPRRGFLERLDAWFWAQEQRANEAYLSRATDVYDLEARIRDLERGAIRRYY